MLLPGGTRAVSSRANREGALPQMYRSGVLAYSRAQGFRIFHLPSGDPQQLQRAGPRGGELADPDRLVQQRERHGEVNTLPSPSSAREGNDDGFRVLHIGPP